MATVGRHSKPSSSSGFDICLVLNEAEIKIFKIFLIVNELINVDSQYFVQKNRVSNTDKSTTR